MTPDLPIALLVILGIGSFIAGLVDAVVGGGGLVQIPLLFAAFPGASPAVLFGTNKLASVVGTSSAAIQYARRIAVPWRLALPSAGAALLGSWFGAKSVSHFSPELVRPLVLILLVSVAIYTFMRKDFGKLARPSPHTHRVQVAIICAIGLALGFYDGFFGPGTGSFLIFLFIRFLGQDFLQASVTAKIVNVATNLAAIAFFVGHGSVLWLAAGVMASCNLAGAVVGTRLAVARGTGFVRKLFLFVVTALILKLAYDILGT